MSCGDRPQRSVSRNLGSPAQEGRAPTDCIIDDCLVAGLGSGRLLGFVKRTSVSLCEGEKVFLLRGREGQQQQLLRVL